jgi:hypothetical protein
MSAFLDPLDLELMRGPDGRPLFTHAGRQLWRVLGRFRYQSDVAGLAVPHDFIYNMHTVPRAVADEMLYEACLLTGVPKWKAWAIYAGVRVGGGSHWMPGT